MEMNVGKKLGNENLKTTIPNTHYDISGMAQDGIIWVV
jgi:hypothetical protein